MTSTASGGWLSAGNSVSYPWDLKWDEEHTRPVEMVYVRHVGTMDRDEILGQAPTVWVCKECARTRELCTCEWRGKAPEGAGRDVVVKPSTWPQLMLRLRATTRDVVFATWDEDMMGFTLDIPAYLVEELRPCLKVSWGTVYINGEAQPPQEAQHACWLYYKSGEGTRRHVVYHSRSEICEAMGLTLVDLTGDKQ